MNSKWRVFADLTSIWLKSCGNAFACKNLNHLIHKQYVDEAKIDMGFYIFSVNLR